MLVRDLPDGDVGVGDVLDASVIDAAVSAALARVAEPPLENASVVLLAAQVLASDHQWARLHQLAPVVSDLSARLTTERPWLATAMSAVEQILLGRRPRATSHLRAALGLADGASALTTPRNVAHLGDALVAVGLMTWLAERDAEILDSARDLALRSNNASGYELASFLSAYARAADASDVGTVLADSPGWTEMSPRIRRYIGRRGVPTLFPAQAKALREGGAGPQSSVVAMPTSSGKTLIAELKVVASLREPGQRAIYVAPYRVLARQVEADFRRGLRPLQLTVRDLGTAFDFSFSALETPSDIPDVAVMTPERLDGILRLAFSDRRGSEHALAYLRSVVVLVVDEAHLIATPGRGVRLELLLARWRTQFPDCDVLALSGVAGSVEEFAAWLDARPIVGGSRPTGSIELSWRTDGTLVQRFGSSVAKVTDIERSNAAGNDAAELAARVPLRYAPVLVIETTRPIAETFAAKVWRRSAREAAHWRETLTDQDKADIDAAAAEARIAFGSDHPLVAMLHDGVVFHHAGLPANVLHKIEDLAERKLLRVVAATTTVAEGAHLPFQVVLIPHLNFQGESNRLDKSLYLNIVGRAGRAGVAMEGIVIVLESDARTLQGYVHNVLWNEAETVELESRLPSALANRGTFAGAGSERDLESQVLAWLGEPGSYSDDQATELASATFAGLNAFAAEDLAGPISDLLEDLEDRGFAIAASPFRLTGLGQRSRLAGLGTASCARLDRALTQWSAEYLRQLTAVPVLDAEGAETLARLVFEAEEVLENGLWARRSFASDRDRWMFFRTARAGFTDWPYGDELYEIDVQLLTAWITGEPFSAIADLAPTFPRGLFSAKTPGERAADASELVGRLAYPAAWAWLGSIAMLGDRVETVPGWIRAAIESGVPSEVAVRIVEEVGVARPAAVALSKLLSVEWDMAVQELLDFGFEDLDQAGALSPDDLRRLSDWRAAPTATP
jgi:hypothetical protein